MNGWYGAITEQFVILGLHVAAVLGLTAAIFIWRKLYELLTTHLTKSQLQILSALGKEGYVLAETAYRSVDGPTKLQGAMAYVTERARLRGISVTEASVRAAVELAWMEAEGLASHRGQSRHGGSD